MTERLVKCPFTGKMVPARPPRRALMEPVAVVPDTITPTPIPEAAVAPTKAVLVKQLASIRKKYEDIGPTKRYGAEGEKLMKQYRKLSLEFWHVTGKHPPPIHSEL